MNLMGMLNGRNLYETKPQTESEEKMFNRCITSNLAYNAYMAALL